MQISPVMSYDRKYKQTDRKTNRDYYYIYIYISINKLCAPVIRLYCWTIAVPSSTVNSSPPVTIYKHFNSIDKNFANTKGNKKELFIIWKYFKANNPNKFIIIQIYLNLKSNLSFSNTSKVNNRMMKFIFQLPNHHFL